MGTPKMRDGVPLMKDGVPTCSCCGCCHKDPWPTLYATFDQFEIDTPFTPNPDTFGYCSFFCTEAELDVMGLTAVPSTGTSVDGNLAWNYGNGPGTAPPIDTPDVGGIPSKVNLRLTIKCNKFTEDNVWRYQVDTTKEDAGDPADGTSDIGEVTVFNKYFGTGPFTDRCHFNALQFEIANNDPDLHPIMGIAGINCNPFFLQAVVECRIFRWKTFGTPIDGVCYTTGRFRLTITE